MTDIDILRHRFAEAQPGEYVTVRRTGLATLKTYRVVVTHTGEVTVTLLGWQWDNMRSA